MPTKRQTWNVLLVSGKCNRFELSDFREVARIDQLLLSISACSNWFFHVTSYSLGKILP